MNEDKNTFKFVKDLPYLGILGIIFAFLGWIVENVARLVTLGIIDSRFHFLPFISPYGLVVFALYLLIGNADEISIFGHKLFKEKNKKTIVFSNIITFITICLFVFLGELIVGNLWDVLFDVKLWNYTDQPLHVTRYAGLITSLMYGGGVYLLHKFVMYPLLNFFRNKINYKNAAIFSIICGSIIVIDTLIMMITSMFFGGPFIYWSFKL